MLDVPLLGRFGTSSAAGGVASHSHCFSEAVARPFATTGGKTARARRSDGVDRAGRCQTMTPESDPAQTSFISENPRIVPMSISVELSGEELVDLLNVTQQSDQAEAVRQAVREYLRMIRLRELIAASGKIEFDDNWRELEAAELAEVALPVPGTGS